MKKWTNREKENNFNSVKNSKTNNNQINNNSHQTHFEDNQSKTIISKTASSHDYHSFSLDNLGLQNVLRNKVFNSFSNLKSLLTKSKYITISLLSIIFIIALIPIINNIKHQQTTKAEQVGSSPNNSKTSTLKQLYNDLVSLGHGSSSNYWNRVKEAAKGLLMIPQSLHQTSLVVKPIMLATIELNK